MSITDQRWSGKDITEAHVRHWSLQDAHASFAENTAKVLGRETSEPDFYAKRAELWVALDAAEANYVGYDDGTLYLLVEEGRGYRETFVNPMTKTEAKELTTSMPERYRDVVWVTNTYAKCYATGTKTKNPNVHFKLEELGSL